MTYSEPLVKLSAHLVVHYKRHKNEREEEGHPVEASPENVQNEFHVLCSAILFAFRKWNVQWKNWDGRQAQEPSCEGERFYLGWHTALAWIAFE